MCSSGLLRKHRGGLGTASCKGSGTVPVGGEGAASEGGEEGEEKVVEDSGGVGVDPSDRQLGTDLYYAGPILKRIPKGARLYGAHVLARTLRRVAERPEEVEPWLRLFSFPGALAKPVRGGVKRNLTASVLARLKLFDEGGVLVGVGGKDKVRRRRGAG